MIAKCPPSTITKVFHERAFPYIGKPALAYFAYLGILFQHRHLTSNATNQGTDMWRSLLRLLLSILLISLFIWQLRLVDWSDGILALYFNKTFVPCGGSAFLLCSFAEPLFEHLGLMNRDYGQKYCVYVHEDTQDRGSSYVNGPTALNKEYFGATSGTARYLKRLRGTREAIVEAAEPLIQNQQPRAYKAA